MANTKKFIVKNGLLTQNVDFVSPNSSNTISLTMLDSDTLSVSGNSGQLFSITDSQSGTIFAVNDISGVPSIEVFDTGKIQLAETFGNVLIGTAVDNTIDKLQVNGSITSTILKSSVVTGTAPLSVVSTTLVSNLNADMVDGLQASAFYLATNPSGYTTNTGTVTSVAALTLGTTGTDVSSSVATGTTTPVITLNIPTASATNRGALSAADWTTFNNKQPAGAYLTSAVTTISFGTTGLTPSTATAGAVTIAGTLAVANGGTGSTTTAGALTNLGAYAASNPAGYTTNTGTVTSVSGTGTVSGLTLSGTVTTTGNLTLGGALSVTPSNFASQTANTFLAAPNGAAGVPTFRTIVASDVPTLNQSTTGSAGSVTSAITFNSSGTGAASGTTFNGSAAQTISYNTIGAYAATNPNGYTSNIGTVTGVTGTAPVVSSGGIAPVISMAAATASVNGYMTSTYAAKLDGIAAGATANTGTVTSVTVSSPLTGGTITTSGTIGIQVANATQNGYLTTTDWNTFNNKQNLLVSGTNIKTINGTSVLGSGDLVVTSGASTLDALTDVVITTPSDGQVLSYNNASSTWVNTTPTGGALSGYNTTIGDGSAVSYTITHNLNKTNIFVSIREISSGYFVYPDIKYTSSNTLVVEFALAPSTNQYTIAVIGF